MILLAGIDGTGTSDDAEYNTEFANSHVRSLTRIWTWRRHGPAFYQRGPGNFGTDTGKRAHFAADFLVNYLTMRTAMKQRTGVFLAGYSRGAAAALHACRLLHRKNIGVDCLMMFDAVDRTNDLDADLIPANVRVCFHAIRNPMTLSRAWFENCGRQRESGGTGYTEKMFFCTHGAVGGTPWKAGNGVGGLIRESHGWILPTRENQGTPGFFGQTAVHPMHDSLGSQQVWNWSQNALRQTIEQCKARIANPDPATEHRFPPVPMPSPNSHRAFQASMLQAH
jgi:hypothetical protein